MVEHRDGAGLRKEAAFQVGIVEAFRAWDLECHPAAQGRINAQKNNAMSAAPELTLEHELAELLGPVAGQLRARPEAANPLEALECVAQPLRRLGAQAGRQLAKVFRSARRADLVDGGESSGELALEVRSIRGGAQVASGFTSSRRKLSIARNQSMRTASGDRPRTRPISLKDWFSRLRSSMTRR